MAERSRYSNADWSSLQAEVAEYTVTRDQYYEREAPEALVPLPNIMERADLSVPDDWRDRAACLGMDGELFFPGKEDGSNTDNAAAKEVCEGCPVRHDCLEYALEAREKYGIWGGTSERERRDLRRERGLGADRWVGCEQCGTRFLTQSQGLVKYCGNQCKQAAYKSRAALAAAIRRAG